MSKRKIIVIISMLLVVILSASVISYSVATRGVGSETQNEIQSELTKRSASVTVDYKTNIDLIIENSNKSGDEAQTFNIVEIVPVGTNGSDLTQYISNGYFKSNVFDAHTTKSAKMKEGMILLDVIPVSAATSLSDEMNSNITKEKSSLNDILNKADLIYISSPTYSAYNNNMSEDIYNFLHTYALGKDKPVIVDYVKPSDDNSVNAPKTYKDLVSEIRTNYIRFRTFPWKSELDADAFFTATPGSGSYYVKYDTNTTAYMGNVLVITKDANEASSMYQKMVNADESAMINKAYYGSTRPGSWSYQFADPATVTAEELDGYDFVLLENNIMSTTISNDLFSKLKTLSESNKYIFYDFRGSFDENTSSSSSTNNYLKLMSMILATNGVSKQSNVLSVRYGFFTSLNDTGAQKEAAAAAKGIADIINSAIYRDTSVTGENGSKFRVLEIEPCYPIDLQLAQESSVTWTAYTQNDTNGKLKGSYYTVPDQVRLGVTTDEIEEGTEYYAFEVSKAKISHALGIPYNMIEIDQVSANELISTKAVIGETYDLVYIGGDHSALIPSTHVNYWGIGNWTGQSQDYYAAIETFTSFNMYSHTGNFVDYQISNGYQSISGGSNSLQTNGYDLTTIKRNELKDYIDAGLPLMIDKVVADAFEESYAADPEQDKWDNRGHSLKQLSMNNIDPDSNMYQLLKYAYLTKENEKAVFKNIGWGIVDTSLNGYTTMIDNDDRSLGNTLGTQVTVYNKTISENIASLKTNSAERPSLNILSYPMEYEEGNDATTNTEKTVSFTAKVAEGGTKSYTFSLYVDENGDGVYSEGEFKCSADGQNVTLSYDLEDGFFGLVNWKVIVNEKGSVLCDSKTGCAFYKLDSEMKKTIRVLQIMPVEKASQGGFSDGHSLYFCTECQQSTKMINYNVTVNGQNADKNPGLNSQTDTDKIDGVYVGLHEHKFGIVKYNPNLVNDDWEDNFADVITHDSDGLLDKADFEFDLDIVTVDEFDALCEAADKRTSDEVTENEGVAAELFDELQSAETGSTLQSYETILQNELFKVATAIKASGGGNYKSLIVSKLGTSADPGQWIVDKDYYKFWEYCNSSADPSLYGSVKNSLDSLRTAYANYITEYDKVIQLREQYKEYSRGAGDGDTWLQNNYDIIVLGFADEFNGRDLKVTSCTQLRDYVAAGGSILNTHDTMTKYNNRGAVNLTNALRESFGMDRFHVTGVSNGLEAGALSAMLSVSDLVLDSTKITRSFGPYTVTGDNGFSVSLDADEFEDREYGIIMGQYYGIASQASNPTIQHGENDYSDIKLTFMISNYDGTPRAGYALQVKRNTWPNEVVATATTDADGKAIIAVPQTLSGDGIIKGSSTRVNVSAMDISIDATITGAGITIDNTTSTALAEDSTEATITLKLKTSGGTSVPVNTDVSLKVGSTTYTGKTDTNSQVSFAIPVSDISSALGDYLTVSSGDLKYRKYTTKNDSVYFWTERLKAESPSDYGNVISSSGMKDHIKYNSPVGVADMWATYDSKSQRVANYVYVMMEPEAFDHRNLDTDGWNFEAKYGTRKASRVNQGGVTMYPFAVSNELIVSGTHAQMFALDLEDPTVNVLYTLGPNFVGDGVDAEFARYDSGIFAASPHDGMNSYFLYSKANVFYTGAGHAIITGRLKDNNDERRLFINIIVNSVSKGVSKPKLKLYNKCDKDGHENCEDNYVDPEDDVDNEKLSQEMNTLFYNAGIGMYQYNIDDSQNEIYPEFDFKAIAGTAEIKEIKVFYDLNYGTDTGMNTSDTYTADTDHVLIKSYDLSDQMDSKRVKLREKPFPKLLLKEEYFKPYNDNYTYIVIYVKDAKGWSKSARVKINVIPRLFDLTDAEFDYDCQSITSVNSILDMTDRKKFNI